MKGGGQWTKDEADASELANDAVTPIVIDSAAFEGKDKGDWQKAARAYIAAHLQRLQPYKNINSGKSIRINALSKSESVNKIRNEQQMRPIKQLDQIIQDAIYLGYEHDVKSKPNVRGYDFYAIPVVVDGKEYAAWFNVQRSVDQKTPVQDRYGVFYQFGAYTKSAQSSLKHNNPEESSDHFATGHVRNKSQFLEEIKQYLPAAQKNLLPDSDDDSVPASNSAPIYPELIEEAIMRVTKIRAVQLNDLTDIIDEMIESEELSDDELEAYSQRIIKAIPQNLSPEATEAMAEELARKMGEAITKQISQSL